MATTIVTKNSSTASAVPTAAQLVQGELAVNVADKKLYTEDNAGSIIVLADGVKLDGIEALADVTDTANVTAAGALMDSELTNITAVKALNQGVATTDSPSFVGLTASGEITANGGIALGDNDKATFGDSDDLQIYHTGSNSVIADAGTGNLIVRANDLRMTSYALEHNFLQANESGAVTLYHNNAAKLATTATGIDVTGTATMDSLTTDDDVAGLSTLGRYSSGFAFSLLRPSSSALGIEIRTNAGNTLAHFLNDGTTKLHHNGTAKLTTLTTGIEVTGDISGTWTSGANRFVGSQFLTGSDYQLGMKTTMDTRETQIFAKAADTGGYVTIATGTTPSERLRVDGSGNVGIGTSSPSDSLHLKNNSSYQLRFDSSGANKWRLGAGWSGYYEDSFIIADTTAGNRLVIDPNGSVGIGTSSPTSKIHVARTDAAGAYAYFGASSDGGARGLQFTSSDSDVYLGAIHTIDATSGAGQLAFATAGTERLRIDSSGNLLVGTTSAYGTTGTTINAAGLVYSSAAADRAGQFDRTTNDGELVRFSKAGTTVGSIGTGNSGNLYIGSGDTGINFNADINSVYPINPSNGAASNGAIDLGYGGIAFKNLYLSSGVYLGGGAPANLLDDYEEGTWTPTLNMTSGSVSYSSQLGQYTKIGNQVTLTGWIYISGVSSPSGALNITVPFTASSTLTRPATMIMANNTTGVTGNLGAWINPNTQSMYLQIVNNADMASLDGSNMASNTELYVTITYITT